MNKNETVFVFEMSARRMIKTQSIINKCIYALWNLKKKRSSYKCCNQRRKWLKWVEVKQANKETKNKYGVQSGVK